MRTLLLRALCLLSLATLPIAAGCSALGLDNLPQSNCVMGGPGFCDSLETVSPTGDDCRTWQCNPTSGHCEPLARDDDGDHAPAMMCAPAGTSPDCDDDDALNFPSNPEACNGRDDDCDGVIDDGAIAIAVAGDATLPATTNQILVTTQPDADEAYVLARTGAALKRVLVSADAAPSSADVALVDPSGALIAARDLAIAGIGSNNYAVVLARSGAMGCQQWGLAPITASSPNAVLRTADESLIPACPPTATPIAAPSVAGRTNAPLLVGWIEADPSSMRACGSASAATVVLGAGQFDSRPTGNRIGDATVRLGETVDLGAVSMLPLAAPSGTGAFLVAYPTMDGAIAVHHVSVSPMLVITDDGIVYSEPAGAMRRQGVTLAAGPTVGSDTTIALSYYEGCGGENAISVRWLTLSGSALTSTGVTTGLGTGLARSLVQVVYQARSSDWLVAWRSSTGLGAQRVFEDGALEGDPIEVLVAGTVSAFALSARTMGPLFQATAVADGTDVQVLTFGCAAP